MNARPMISAVAAALLTLAACGSDAPAESRTSEAPSASTGTSTGDTVGDSTGDTTPASTVQPRNSITLVAYDSFPQDGTSLNDALNEFTAESGIAVELLIAGDTGTMLAKAGLTAGNPEGDVMWGVDNTFLSRAIDDGIFESYVDAPTAALPPELTAFAPNGEVIPVDFGDVCVNYDIGYFADNDLAVPTSMQDLTDAAYRDLLVVENPATSSPGLAFMMASVAEFGVDGWRTYWSDLVANGVEVVDGWSDAYYGSFSWAGNGDRPLVVSYGTSPPAEVIFADPPRDDSPTGVIESTCFRQVEFVGVLAGTDAPIEARELIDFLVSERFQSELALNLFVYPANIDTALPQEFVDFAVMPATSLSLDPAFIDRNRTIWIDEWTDLVLG